MNDPVWIVLLIFAINALVWIPIILWYTKKKAALVKEIEDSVLLSGEHAIVGPQSLLFVRPAFIGISSVNAVAALTDRQLIVMPFVGKKVEIPLSEITDVRQSKWYRSSFRGGFVHVVLKLRDRRELALLVINPQRWLEGLAQTQTAK